MIQNYRPKRDEDASGNNITEAEERMDGKATDNKFEEGSKSKK
jgi:hypothetical protein